jgi:hypothetical protein
MLAALGFRAHSGWAALVAVTEPISSPAVVLRRRILTADPNIAGSKQPFHAAEDWPLAKAEKYIEHCSDSSHQLALEAVRKAVDELQQAGHVPIACGAIVGSGRQLPELQRILASHALLHAAEGEFFRNVIAAATERCKLRNVCVKERELLERCRSELAPEKELQKHLAALGRALGPPWRQDEKFATLAAWLALSTCTARARRSSA